MSDDTRMQQLLDQLYDSNLTPEEVCKTCPELLPEVRKRWLQFCSVQAELDEWFPLSDDKSGDSSSSHIDTTLPQVPDYEIESILGQGGMGIVFLARDLRLKRRVALKMAGRFAGPRERERFQREAEAIASLVHSNIVQIYDVGVIDGRLYFTMEHVEGGSLCRKLAGTPLPAREAAELISTLADAMQLAHQSGIVHRDLKPSNILLTAEGTPKISDFGLVLRLDGPAGLTRTGTAVGTPSYMAPEQASSQALAVGPAADIYALGAILYEMLTGRPPFLAETAAETVLQVLMQEPVPPSRLNATVPRDLETICLKCLNKETRFRYSSAAELAKDLRRYLNGQSILARPESWLMKCVRRIRRRPGFYALIALILFLSLALLSGGVLRLSERAAIARGVAARERAADEDLSEMENLLRKSPWTPATAAWERARGRLGERGSEQLHLRLDQGKSDLHLAEELIQIRLKSTITFEGIFQELETVFVEAGIGRVGDDLEICAGRIEKSNIRQALINALDFWACYSKTASERDWLLSLTRKVDPDPNGWRDRFRDPALRRSKEALTALADSIDVENTPVEFLVSLGELLRRLGGNAIPFLKKVQCNYPQDLWVNLFLGAKNDHPEESIRFNQVAVAIAPENPILNYNLGYSFIWAQNPKEALFYFTKALLLEPNNNVYRAGLAECFFSLNQNHEALELIQEGLSKRHSRFEFGVLQNVLRCILCRQQSWDEARIAWEKALDNLQPEHLYWYGYAELCLYLSLEDKYLRARQDLLEKFSSSEDPYIAERVSRACLLLPLTGEELQKSLDLARRAAGVYKKDHLGAYPYFQFVLGLAEFRQGNFEQAISILRGEASKMTGPAPRLVLAMALKKTGQEAEAKKILKMAVESYDWNPVKVTDQDGMIRQILRREAESLILQALPEKHKANGSPSNSIEKND